MTTKAIDVLRQPSWIKPQSAAVWPAVCDALDRTGMRPLPAHAISVWLLCDAITAYLRACSAMNKATDLRAKVVIGNFQRTTWATVERSLQSCCLSPYDLQDIEGFQPLETGIERLKPSLN